MDEQQYNQWWQRCRSEVDAPWGSRWDQGWGGGGMLAWPWPPVQFFLLVSLPPPLSPHPTPHPLPTPIVWWGWRGEWEVYFGFTLLALVCSCLCFFALTDYLSGRLRGVKVSPTSSIHGFGAGRTCTRMSWSMSSTVSMPLTSSRTASALTPTTTSESCHLALVGTHQIVCAQLPLWVKRDETWESVSPADSLFSN